MPIELESLPFLEQLELYYKHVFPSDLLQKWLEVWSESFSKREFSFNIKIQDEEIYCRYLAFENHDKLKQELVKKKPIKIDIGAVYNVSPNDKYKLSSEHLQSLEKEFVIDIDMDAYDQVRTCCQGSQICDKCWKFLQCAANVLQTCLQEDFGFEHMCWVFSGRRGIHCWVSDGTAQVMNNHSRAAVIEFMNYVVPSVKTNSKIKDNLLSKPKNMQHPSVRRAFQIINKYFQQVILKEQNLIFLKKQVQQEMLELIKSHVEVHRVIQQSWNRIVENQTEQEQKSIQMYDIYMKAIEQFRQTKDLKMKERMKLEHLEEELVIGFMYPRLDLHVSTDMKHLLKSPFVIHPSTGNVCVPLCSLEMVNTFFPSQVPTLKGILADIDFEQPNTSNQIQNTRVAYYVQKYRDFINDCVKQMRLIKRNQKINVNNGLLVF